MPKSEWGVKRICPTTGKRFYDLNKSPIISPYTGSVVELETSNRRGGSSVAASVAAEKAKKRPEPVDEDELLVDDEAAETETDDDLLEDDEDDTVSLDDLTDVPGADDD
jgi:uncharacterized protein (TIGR02300 family)